MLKTVFPEERWNISEFSPRHKKSRQRLLLLKLQDIFKNEEIIEEYSHPDLKRNSGFCAKFDVFIPKLNLAFEFHGEQHYKEMSPTGFASFEVRKNREMLKNHNFVPPLE